MSLKSMNKYRPFPPVDLPDRQWPSRVIDHPPHWCSVDLRDGNQALIEPMGSDRKRRMFELLVRTGFKEIEVGFPAASRTDYDFIRTLIEENMIPRDVTIQVLTQAREHLIRRTFESLRGVKQAIVHIYNSTSALQRRVVFGVDRSGIIDIAVRGARLMKELAAEYPETRWTFQYSPESFTGTELDFAVEICDSVAQVWQPSPEQKVIINLPATVEMATPNVYADQVEWFSRHIRQRESIVLSIHPHNDRGTGIAAAEFALMAGAERVEGTLFGNGERTGNVDLVTMALNMYTQGVTPGLDLTDLNAMVREVEYCNQLPVHPRHPYAGELVFTAFSGSHQDAIKKGFTARKAADTELWEIPYLPIDPADVGRSYEAVIRINSQSGKGGIAYLLERCYGVDLPQRLQYEFSQTVQAIADETGKELSTDELWSVFRREYVSITNPYYRVVEHRTSPESQAMVCRLTATIREHDQQRIITAKGNGPIDAFVQAFQHQYGFEIQLVDYREHATGLGADATAVAYVEARVDKESAYFGVGMHANIVTASLQAVVNAINRSLRNRADISNESQSKQGRMIAGCI